MASQKKRITIMLDFNVFMDAEKDRLKEASKTGQATPQKDYYAEMIVKYRKHVKAVERELKK